MTTVAKSRASTKSTARKRSTKSTAITAEKNANVQPHSNLGFLFTLLVTGGLVILAAWSQSNANTKPIPATAATPNITSPQADPLPSKSNPQKDEQAVSSSGETADPVDWSIAAPRKKQPSISLATSTQQSYATPATPRPISTVRGDSSLIPESGEVGGPTPELVRKPTTTLDQVVHDLVHDTLGSLPPVRF